MAKPLAWGGGALFVASLALTAWWYLIKLGRSDAASALFDFAALAIDAALVTIFALHHSLFARDAVKRRLTAIPPRMMRSFYVWIASLLLIAVVLLWRPIGGNLYEHSGASAIAHAALQVLGVFLIAKAVGGLDALELAGIRQALGAPPATEGLQVDGVYGLVRHPLYLGWMLVVFGTAHMTGDRLAFAALTSAYLVAAVPWEERSLRQSFGDEYARYAKQVRWRIVPYVY